ncbi:VMAP-C domain-containing protein [Bremerella volcania]|nr:effector-associated domain EAD1-containing protein [Bremerella volcania]
MNEQQKISLDAAILSAFGGSKSSLTRCLSTHLGIHLGQILDTNQGLKAIVAELREIAVDSGWLRPMLRAMRADCPGNTDLSDWCQNTRLGELTLVQEQQLEEFLVSHVTREKLDQLLESLGQFLSVIAADETNPQAAIRLLVERASSEHWARLLCLVVAVDCDQEEECRRVVEQVLGAEGKASVSLYQLLKDHIQEQKAADCLRRAIGSYFNVSLAKARRTIPVVCYEIVRAQALATRSTPLTTFCRLIRKDLETPQQQQLEQWWNETVQRLNWTLEFPRDEQNIQACKRRFFILVELKESERSTPAQIVWMPRSWLYDRELDDYEELGADHPDTHWEDCNFPNYLRMVRDSASKLGVPLRDLTFEFFVSLESFQRPVDQFEIPFNRFVNSKIGVENPVVIRSLECNADSIERVRDRWDQLVANNNAGQSLVKDGQFTAAVVHLVEEKSIGELFNQYESDQHLACMVFDRPLPSQLNEHEMAGIFAAVAAGVPIIIGARSGDVTAELRQKVLLWLQQSLFDLPEQVRQLRVEGKSDIAHLGQNLTLFFENGEYFLPERESFGGAR